MDNKAIFSANLKRYMELNQKSRKEICDALGFNYYTFSDWINGKKYPRMDKIERLASYFGIQKSDLIEEKRNIPTISPKQGLSDFILQYRTTHNLTQNQFANLCGLSPECIAIIESKGLSDHEFKHWYDVSIIKQIANATNTDIEKLAGTLHDSTVIQYKTPKYNFMLFSYSEKNELLTNQIMDIVQQVADVADSKFGVKSPEFDDVDFKFVKSAVEEGIKNPDSSLAITFEVDNNEDNRKG